MALFDIDFEPESFVTVELIYNKNDPDKNTNIFFDFQIVYTRAVPEEEDHDHNNLETRTIRKTQEFVRETLFRGSDKQEITDTVFSILRNIEVPYYGGIINNLTNTMIDLKKREALCVSPMVERVKVVIKLMVSIFPREEVELPAVMDYLVEQYEMDVELAVAPARDEAVEEHLETVVVVENDEGCCVICMDEFKVDSDLAVVRMPCLHVFHRMCVEEWLRRSGICPVCRAVFPSLTLKG